MIFIIDFLSGYQKLKRKNLSVLGKGVHKRKFSLPILIFKNLIFYNYVY